ncbi:hypothetical protein L6164_037700 [Bauhinia variegata]|uniref:Uncharacterized protein n=1 Tax=Bauhinia variegata TaxID=167791 RepID=A0ACB9KKN1_BAUVA|nr:hypothetical protein L6164_037700 [Bauhinia variegata]
MNDGGGVQLVSIVLNTLASELACFGGCSEIDRRSSSTNNFSILLKFFFLLLESIRLKLKLSSHTPEGWIGKTAQCFLRCIEWTIKSVNRNAYIMQTGTNRDGTRDITRMEPGQAC